jgi:isopenicillin N synthase-like dioxygenase
MQGVQKIPTVDLNDFISGDPVRKAKFVQDIGEAYEKIGFVALSGHFLSDALVDKLYGQVRAFFDLPTDIKAKYEILGISGQRGLTSFGKEHAKGSDVPDLKEFWHLGQQLNEGSKYKGVYPDNVEVTELPEFDKIGVEAYQMLQKTGVYVLRALALFIGIDEFYFDGYIAEGNSILRSIYYPAISEDPKNAVRAGAHTDINLITLLMGAQGRGLQVMNHAGEWIDAIAEPDELMINVGDMLSRHTNNRLVSTRHRVINPEKENWDKPRYSIPFFMHPVSDMKLNCLTNCIDDNNPKNHEDITAGDFLNQRLREIGLG